MLSKPRESQETGILREKIRVKKIDRKVYVDEMEGILNSNREKRNALRIGNDCLRFMTQRQEDLSMSINSRIFAERSRQEKQSMQKCNLASSIVKNDGRLFRLGKRLLKQDYQKVQTEKKEKEQGEELQRAEIDLTAKKKDFKDRSEVFMHKQAEVEDFQNREVAAKLINARLEKILEQLKGSLKSYPIQIRDLEHSLSERKKELEDFQDLKAGALRFLEIEQRQLDPLNEELALITTHFDKLIAVEKNELDDRRKKSSLSKFLSEREAHSFNFTGSSNIMETKIKARNAALVNAKDTLIDIMDAMLLTDVKHVVDSIVDQDEVTKLLIREKDVKLALNEHLAASLHKMISNCQFLKYNGIKRAEAVRSLEDALKREEDERNNQEQLDKQLVAQDRLRSEIHVSLHALFEKLRPVKIPDPDNLFVGNMIVDVKRFKLKLTKMVEVIDEKTVPVGHVKPLMLHVFQQRRIPADSMRVVLNEQMHLSGLGGLDAYEADQPGYISREMLKTRADETAAPKKKKKRDE